MTVSFVAVPGTTGRTKPVPPIAQELAGLPGRPHGLPRCQDSVILWHLAVLPFAVYPFTLAAERRQIL